jgi:hypothetical protein
MKDGKGSGQSTNPREQGNPLNPRDLDTNVGPSRSEKKCYSCGKALHGQQNKDRLKACKAVNLRCNKCNFVGHLEKVCKNQKTVAGITEETAAEITEVSEGSFFHMVVEEQEDRGNPKTLEDSHATGGKEDQ